MSEVRHYLGIRVVLDSRVEEGWVWAVWPDGRRFKHWAAQLTLEPWATARRSG